MSHLSPRLHPKVSPQLHAPKHIPRAERERCFQPKCPASSHLRVPRVGVRPFSGPRPALHPKHRATHPIAPRTKRRGGGPNEDQPTSAPQMALSHTLRGSMRPLPVRRLPKEAPHQLDQNQVARPDRWPDPLRRVARCGRCACVVSRGSFRTASTRTSRQDLTGGRVPSAAWLHAAAACPSSPEGAFERLRPEPHSRTRPWFHPIRYMTSCWTRCAPRLPKELRATAPEAV